MSPSVLNLKNQFCLVALIFSAASSGNYVHAFTTTPQRRSAQQRNTRSSTNAEFTKVLNAVNQAEEQAALQSVPPPRSTGLALQLDDGTRKSHSMAENTAFVTGFFKGMSNRSSFASLVTSLYHVYSAMEEAFDVTADDRVKALDKPELRRVQALRQDMQFYYGNESKIAAPTAATMAYVNRVKEVARDEPYLLVAHQYTRYLGDLFGGQMMGGMAMRSLDLEPGQGIKFYEFDGISNTKVYIEDWYRDLNALEFTEEQKQAIVDEANLVFTLNIGIFEELDGSPFKAMFAIFISTLKSKLGMSPALVE